MISFFAEHAYALAKATVNYKNPRNCPITDVLRYNTLTLFFGTWKIMAPYTSNVRSECCSLKLSYVKALDGRQEKLTGSPQFDQLLPHFAIHHNKLGDVHDVLINPRPRISIKRRQTSQHSTHTSCPAYPPNRAAGTPQPQTHAACAM